jgi:signal transduction histidine kinase
MRMARALLWLLLSVYGLIAHASSEQDLILERAVLIEPAPGKLTIEQAISGKYQPFGTVLNRGFSPTVRWVRLLVAAPATDTEQVVLRVGPHYVGEIQLFDQQKGVWTSRFAGDQYPASQNACADNLYCFAITTKAGVDNYFYLRVDTINGLFLTTRVMSPDALSKLIVEQQRIFGVESGVIFAICIWALFVYVRSRHRLVGIFFISQSVTLLFNLSSSGLLASLFFEQHVWLDNLSFNTLYVFRLLVSLYLTYELLRNYGPPKWYNYYVKIAAAILLLELLSIKLGHITPLALNFNFLLITFLPLLLLLALPWCRLMPATHRRLIALGAMLMCGLLWVDILPILGWVRPDLVAAPGNWGGLIVAIILSLIVGSDISHRRVIYDREMQELQFFRARNLVETEQIKERSMLIDMLTHELKNPLATMRMAAGSLRRSLRMLTSEQSADSADRIDSMVQAINNMNTVIERCVQVDQLDQKGFSPKFEDFDVKETVESLLASQPESLRIDFRAPSSPLIFRTDANLFAIVLTNLLDNATKYSEPDTRIVVELSFCDSKQDQPSRLIVRVSNTVQERGAPDPESVFSRYYRGPYAHEKSGTGLGLYLVRSLCKILGGSIRFEHQDGHVHFTVELKQ